MCKSLFALFWLCFIVLAKPQNFWEVRSAAHTQLAVVHCILHSALHCDTADVIVYINTPPITKHKYSENFINW